MLSFPLRWLLAAGLLLTITSVQAQSNPGGSAPSPTLQYRSVFAGYRGFNDQPVAPWSEVNDTVGKIGGWRVYAKEARQPEPTDTNAVPAPTDQGTKGDTPKRMPGSHMGHGGKP